MPETANGQPNELLVLLSQTELARAELPIQPTTIHISNPMLRLVFWTPLRLRA